MNITPTTSQFSFAVIFLTPTNLLCHIIAITNQALVLRGISEKRIRRDQISGEPSQELLIFKPDIVGNKKKRLL